MNEAYRKPNIPSNIGEAVIRTIRHLREPDGSCYADIEKHLLSLYRDVEDKPDSTSIKLYLKNAVDRGILLRLDNGNYKIKNSAKRRRSRRKFRNKSKAAFPRKPSCKKRRSQSSNSWRRRYFSSGRQRSLSRTQNLVNVQHFDFSTPFRSHKDIVKTYRKYASPQKKIYSFCEDQFNFSDQLDLKQPSEDYYAHKNHRTSSKNDKLTKYTINCFTGGESYEDDDLAKKYNLLKQQSDADRDHNLAEPMLSQNKKDPKKMLKEILDEEYSKLNMKQQTINYIQKHFIRPESIIVYSNEKGDSRYDDTIGKTRCSNGCGELKEVCIHAFVHEPSAGDSEYGECVELGKKGGMKVDKLLATERQKDKRVKGKKYKPLHRTYTAKEDIYIVHGIRKGKGKKVKAKEARTSTPEGCSKSDTDLSTLNSSDIKLLTKRTKFISEQEYERKKEKLKKKFEKRFEEDFMTKGGSTATCIPKEISEQKNHKGDERSILTVIDEKCTSLLKVTWATLLILLFLTFCIGGSLIYWLNSDSPKLYWPICIFELLGYSTNI